jgi:hypothetical protein
MSFAADRTCTQPVHRIAVVLPYFAMTAVTKAGTIATQDAYESLAEQIEQRTWKHTSGRDRIQR